MAVCLQILPAHVSYTEKREYSQFVVVGGSNGIVFQCRVSADLSPDFVVTISW